MKPLNRFWRTFCLPACLVFVACGADETKTLPNPTETAPPSVVTMKVEPVMWNQEDTPLGLVAAVADEGDTLVVFGDKGALSFDHGLLASADASETSWLSASILPSADGAGDWFVGITTDGQMYRAHSAFELENIGGRYDLQNTAVLGCTKLKEGRAAFGLESAVAIADGTLVQQYATQPWKTLTGQNNHVALVGEDLVQILDTDTNTTITFALPGALSAAWDQDGQLFVITNEAVYVMSDGHSLTLFYARPDKMLPLKSIVASGSRVWLLAGTELGLLLPDAVAFTEKLQLLPDTRISSSPMGDVWALSGETLLRFSSSSINQTGVVDWQEQIAPIVDRVCNACHLPDGIAKIDLSTYATWVARRPAVQKRVLVDQNMPPASSPALTDAEVVAIETWLKNGL